MNAIIIKENELNNKNASEENFSKIFLQFFVFFFFKQNITSESVDINNMQLVGISKGNGVRDCIYPLKQDAITHNMTMQPSIHFLSPSQHLDVKAGNQVPQNTQGVKNKAGFKQRPRVFGA